MRRLCFGGSFNPIHHGHLVCARAAAEASGFDRVVLIPSATPPHKLNATDIASPHHRLHMCRLAIEGDSFFDVSDVEVARSGPSYTIDTARFLRSQGWGAIHWLIGADMVANLPQWHEPEQLLREVQFVVMARPGWDLSQRGISPQLLRVLAQPVVTPLYEISGSMIRRRVAAGQSIRYLTPPAVESYIQTHQLYRAAPNTNGAPP